MKEQIEICSPGNILSVNVVPDIQIFEELIHESKISENILKNGNGYWWNYSIEYHLQKKNVLDTKIMSFRGQIFEKNAGQAFILCKNPMIANYVIHAFERKEILGIEMEKWVLQEAPYFSDIIWKNPPSNGANSLYQRMFWNFLFILMFFILLTPLELVGVASDILEELELSNKSSSFVTFSLPSLAISLFHSIIIPLSIRFLTEQEKNSLYSKAFSSAFISYMLYSIIIMIFFPLLGAVTLGNLIEQLLTIEITKWNLSLVTNIVLVGDFFVNFIISMAFGSNISDLIFTNQYFTSNFYIYRDSHNEKTAPVFDFAYEYSRILSILCIILVFSISVPLILPFGCLFMTIKYWVDKYNLLYVYRIEALPGNNLQGLVTVYIFIILSISQFINSGLFIASGVSILIWFGGFLAFFSIFTFIIAILIYKYWNNYYDTSGFEINENDCYQHPYLNILNPKE